MTSPGAKQSLEMLVAATLELIERGCNNGSLAPSQQAYFRWRLEGDPKFSEMGVELPSARGETLVRPSWAMAIALVAQREVPQTREFQAAVANLRGLAEIGAHADEYLQSFVFVLARKAFELRPHAPQAAFEGLIRQFLDDINGRPFQCGAEIELEGLALESEKVEPTSGIVLRRPKREDFEEETPYYGPGPSSELSFLRTISAVATISCKGTGAYDAQRAVEKLIVMLRLFEVASVRHLSYQLFGDSLINVVTGRIRSGAREMVHERGYIRSDDEARMLRFWHTLDSAIPSSFYDFGATFRDYRDMAYERYSAALMNPASFEERVASAVMALEALFLKERQELGYRLRVRTAKVLCFLSCLLYTSPSPRDLSTSRMPSSA